MIRSQNVITSTTWANKPSAYITGQPVFISNAGTKGSHWFYDGTRWKPMNGSAVLASLDSASASIANTATVVLQYLIPAGMWQTGDTIRLSSIIRKSGTTDTGIMTAYVGTAGTTSDTNLFSVTHLTAATRQFSSILDFRLESATSVQAVSSTVGYGTPSTATAYPSPVTITSASANALYFSVAVRSSSTNDTVQLGNGILQLISKAN